jgi:hypothetical protein
MFKPSSNRFDHDLEKQGGRPTLAAFGKLEELETKLGTLLSSHIQEIKSLRESLAAGENDKVQKRESSATGMCFVCFVGLFDTEK